MSQCKIKKKSSEIGLCVAMERFTVLMMVDGKQQLIYKQAISNVVV
ncbi:RNA chaperone Hfq [Bacillus pseudomycoides]|nr:RNA chaperone Hfq [Bacillus pseudomycoides]